MSEIRGLQQAQRAMLRIMTSVKPNNSLDRATQTAAIGLHRYLVTVTHVDTGSYRASQYVRRVAPMRYRIYIDPAAINPRSGAKPAVYGALEEARGGGHAAYQRTYQQAPQYAARALAYYVRSLP